MLNDVQAISSKQGMSIDSRVQSRHLVVPVAAWRPWAGEAVEYASKSPHALEESSSGGPASAQQKWHYFQFAILSVFFMRFFVLQLKLFRSCD